MRIATLLTLNILMLTTTFIFSACQKNTAKNTNTLATNTNSTSGYVTDIEKVDFKNFTYSYLGHQSRKTTFTLNDGEKPFGKLDETGFSLIKVDYADLTNDGMNEAIINLSVHKPVSNANMIQVYTIDKNHPKEIWTFWTGNDKVEGGLKRVYAQNNELTVELLGKNKFENGELSYDFRKSYSDSHPTVYTKIHFKWDGERFAVEGKPELFDYDWKNQNKESN